MNDSYVRNAQVIRVVDGDTVDAFVDLGYTVHVRQRFRLLGIDAPEVRGEEKIRGVEVKAFLADLLPVGSMVLVESKKAGKFGRYLGTIFIKKGGESWLNVNQHLLDLGLVEEYKR